jgi:hypothetical protein
MEETTTVPPKIEEIIIITETHGFKCGGAVIEDSKITLKIKADTILCYNSVGEIVRPLPSVLNKDGVIQVSYGNTKNYYNTQLICITPNEIIITYYQITFTPISQILDTTTKCNLLQIPKNYIEWSKQQIPEFTSQVAEVFKTKTDNNYNDINYIYNNFYAKFDELYSQLYTGISNVIYVIKTIVFNKTMYKYIYCPESVDNDYLKTNFINITTSDVVNTISSIGEITKSAREYNSLTAFIQHIFVGVGSNKSIHIFKLYKLLELIRSSIETNIVIYKNSIIETNVKLCIATKQLICHLYGHIIVKSLLDNINTLEKVHKDKIDKDVVAKNNTRLITYIKINNTDTKDTKNISTIPSYNKRFRLFVPQNKDALIVRYAENNVPYYKDNGKGVMNLNLPGTQVQENKREEKEETDETVLREEKEEKEEKEEEKEQISEIAESNSPSVEDTYEKDIYTNTYLLGRFSQVFLEKDKNKEVAERMNAIIDALKTGNPVFIIGYGSSGAGKTSSLIYFNTTDTSVKEEDKSGILIHLCQKMCSEENAKYDTVEFYIKEYYQTTGTGETVIRTPPSPNQYYKYSYNNETRGFTADANNYTAESATHKYRFEPRTVDETTLFEADPKGVKPTRDADPKEENPTQDVDTKEENPTQDVDTKEENPTVASSKVDKYTGDDIGKVLIDLIDTDRFVKATTNNPNSSRSHVLVFVRLTGKQTNPAILVIGDLAGVENEFKCDEFETVQNFLNVPRANTDEKFYSGEFYKYDNTTLFDPIKGGAFNMSARFDETYVEKMLQKFKPLEKQASDAYTIAVDSAVEMELVDYKFDIVRFIYDKIIKDKYSLKDICTSNIDDYKGLWKQWVNDNIGNYEVMNNLFNEYNSNIQQEIQNKSKEEILKKLNTELQKIKEELQPLKEAVQKQYPKTLVVKDVKYSYLEVKEATRDVNTPDKPYYIFKFVLNEYIIYKNGTMSDWVETTNTYIIPLNNRDNVNNVTVKLEPIQPQEGKNIGKLKPVLYINTPIYREYQAKKEQYNAKQDEINRHNGSDTNITNDTINKIDQLKDTIKTASENYNKFFTFNDNFDNKNYDSYANTLVKIMRVLELYTKFEPFIKAIQQKYNYGKQACDSRRNEGKFINKSLEDIRKTIAQIMTAKSLKDGNDGFTAPNYINYCVNEFCDSGVDCFPTTTSEIATQPEDIPSILFQDIYKGILELDSNKKYTVKQFYENILVCLFCVFNVAKKANNPPTSTYIDINKLKKLYSSIDNVLFVTYAAVNSKRIDKILTEIQAIKSKLSPKMTSSVSDTKQTEATLPNTNPNTELLKSIDKLLNDDVVSKIIVLKELKETQNEITPELLKKVLKEVSIVINRELPDIIEVFDNHNAASSIGTLEFTDKFSKLYSVQTMCRIRRNDNKELDGIGYTNNYSDYSDTELYQKFTIDSETFDEIDNLPPPPTK